MNCSTSLFVALFLENASGIPCVASIWSNERTLNQAHVIKRVGDYRWYDCSADIRIRRGDGDALYLFVRSKNKGTLQLTVADVTAFATARRQMVYSVSPVYGKSGVFTFDCRTEQTTRIVPPDSHCPEREDGCAYYEIRAVTEQDVEYAYIADVEKPTKRAIKRARWSPEAK